MAARTFLLGLACILPLVVGTGAGQPEDLPPSCSRPRAAARRSVNASTLLAEADVYCRPAAHTKRFPGETLAFVTPWNGHGYDVAKTFTGKLTWISPVWLQLRLEGGSVRVTGTHDIDAGWLRELRRGCSTASGAAPASGCPRIVPRVVWEIRALPSAGLVRDAVSAVLSVVREHGFDGVVLEVPVREAYWPLVRALGEALHAETRKGAPAALAVGPDGELLAGAAAGQSPVPASPSLSLILVLPPKPGLSAAALSQLAAHVDRLSLMSYDAGGGRGDLPNAPLPWVRSVVAELLPPPDEGPAARSALLSKLLLGVPFYGWEGPAGEAGEAMTRGGYLRILKEHSPRNIKLDAAAGEHKFSYRKGEGAAAQWRVVHYPTAWSVAARLDLAAELGTAGVAIWEVGQGLDSWWDML